MLIAIPVFLIAWLAPRFWYAPIAGFVAAFLVETFRLNMVAGYRETVASLAMNFVLLTVIYLAGAAASLWWQRRRAQHS